MSQLLGMKDQVEMGDNDAWRRGKSLLRDLQRKVDVLSAFHHDIE